MQCGGCQRRLWPWQARRLLTYEQYGSLVGRYVLHERCANGAFLSMIVRAMQERDGSAITITRP